MPTRSHKHTGFRTSPLYRTKEPHVFHYLKQRASFWIATLSLIAFVTGNMVGQHGWYAFWKSVLGRTDDNLIVYTGTVAPIDKVPDYESWSRFGGDVSQHTYRQVPPDFLRDLPFYNQGIQQRTDRLHGRGNDVYSVGYLGSYATGAENAGSHPGIDIRVPIGTPVRSIANGIVEEVKEGGGFGQVIVIRHPNVPDPDNPLRTTTLYSCYAHLSAMYVAAGDIVHRAEHIADSGDSGFASGPHLHFQVDRQEAPWHPYWPFTTAEAARRGLTMNGAVNSHLFQYRGHQYTVHPMLYVQANYAPTTLVAQAATHQESAVKEVAVIETKPVLTAAQRRVQRTEQLLSARDERLQLRLARRQLVADSRVAEPQPAPASRAAAPSAPAPPPAAVPAPVVVQTTSMAAARTVSTGTPVASVRIRHDGSYAGRAWEQVTITLVDAQGNIITTPQLNHDLYLRTEYGEAEFWPSRLSVLDFVQGELTVKMLPRSRRTIVIQVQPFNVLSAPMVYRREG